MTILEQLNAINATFQRLHQDFLRFDREIQALSSRFAGEAADEQRKWDAERTLTAGKREDVLKFYRIAKDNSHKELVTGLPGQRPDLARLNQMIQRIDVNDRSDPTAGQIIDLCSQYVSWLDRELAQIDQKGQSGQLAVDRRKEQEAARLTQQKKQVLVSCERYLQGPEVANLVRLFEDIHRDYEITPAYFRTWGAQTKRRRMMLFGFQQFPMDVPQKLCAALAASLGHHFDEKTKLVNCPCGFTTDSPEEIHVEYVDRNEDRAKKGIQALILNFLRYFPLSEYRVTVLDHIHYNADVLGPLAALSAGKHSPIEACPQDAKALRQSISILANYYRKVESKIGSQTLHQYNRQQKPEHRIPCRILILNRTQDLFRGSEEPELAYVINNAKKFGIILIQMTKSSDGGSKGKDREQKLLASSKDCIRIISDAKGAFYVENDVIWMPFAWLDAPDTLPGEFVSRIVAATKPKELGTRYFTRYPLRLPAKSSGKRRPITVPFAIDEDDQVISATFENDLFAAYIMGAAGSGKSTLLHTIISGLMMNYHPDEVELWLLDFKMLEFKRYVDRCPPHVKYILLEKSQDLVFDILDHLTALLDRRQFLFSQKGWSKLSDVPPEENIPAIFIIIDEFAQMSQILRETKGTGYGSDYTIKLENLLAKGRALGLKFIFASQTYTTGISGLTETACKQIQLRFALKNTADEIRQTLSLTSDQITPELSRSIADLPPYETIFKWSDGENNVHIGRYRNLYALGSEIEALVDKLNSTIRPVGSGPTGSTTCLNKKPVLIDGTMPKTFASQVPGYREYEAALDPDDLESSDVLIYPGVPCSFNLARPFPLCNATAENILIAGGDRDSSTNLVLSVLNSYGRGGREIEIWAHERSPIYKRYKNTLFAKRTQRTDLAEICTQIYDLKEAVQKRRVPEKLIVCFGYELMASDFEILGEGAAEPVRSEKPQSGPPAMDMNTILEQVRSCTDIEEKKRLIAQYNQMVAQGASAPSQPEEAEEGGIYDAQEDVKWILKRAPNYGLHFLFCFEKAQDFADLRIDDSAFRHKLLFPMSKDDSYAVMRSQKANTIEDGTCLYTNGKSSVTLRPHIYRGLPCNGWIIDDRGSIIQRG